MKIRWEGTILIVEGTDGEEMRFENAYVKDSCYSEPKAGMVAWKSEVKVSDIQAGLKKIRDRKNSD